MPMKPKKHQNEQRSQSEITLKCAVYGDMRYVHSFSQLLAIKKFTTSSWFHTFHCNGTPVCSFDRFSSSTNGSFRSIPSRSPELPTIETSNWQRFMSWLGLQLSFWGAKAKKNIWMVDCRLKQMQTSGTGETWNKTVCGSQLMVMDWWNDMSLLWFWLHKPSMALVAKWTKLTNSVTNGDLSVDPHVGIATTDK